MLTTKESKRPSIASQKHWRTWTKVILSLLIVFHVVAIFCAPASVDPASRLTRHVWTFCSSYLRATNLNHGYHFFAPEPGSSTTLEYIGLDQEGNRSFGRIPDKSTMQPRLLYHRHFMLTEFLGSIPSESGETRQAVLQAYAQQLLKQNGFSSVELKLVRHRPSSRQEILLESDLSAPETFTYEPLGTFKWSEK
jgi:hypothetical protein